MENQDHVNEEREMVEEVLFEGRVEEGVAITISDSDDYYEELVEGSGVLVGDAGVG